MRYDNADLHPEHARRIIIVAVVMWSVFHIAAIIKILIERNDTMLLILVLPIIVNIWCVIRIIRFYKTTK